MHRNIKAAVAQGGAADSLRASVPVPRGRGLRAFLAFVGPGYLVATGYMDPGNWSTALAGGSAFGYQLLVVALLSNIMAIILQALAARLGLATGQDLAQASRRAVPKSVGVTLWLLAELAICATDLAEVIGTAIALKLLFGIPLAVGAVLTALDVFLVLALQRLGVRWLEAFVMSLLLLISGCFLYQVLLARPDWGAVAQGFLPSSAVVCNPAMLYIALGIIGATVMPHNLYLHSAIVQTRHAGETMRERRASIGFAVLDSSIALMLALSINAALLILAAAVFHNSGHPEVTDLSHAHRLIAPILGSGLAATLFAVALLACGLNSTVTATLAGQIVMEGFLELRIPAWARRLLTRLVAVVPAVGVTLAYGEASTGQLLVLSQVILGLQLPFAVVPLVWLTSRRPVMGELVAPRWLTAISAAIAALIIALNVKLVADLALGSGGLALPSFLCS